MRYWSVLGETFFWSVSRHIIVLLHVTENHWESIAWPQYPVQSYCSSYTRLLILSTVLITVHRVYNYCLLSLYRPGILGMVFYVTWILADLTELINNVNGQLILGLGKLMEETTSVFWVDLGYRLRSRHTVSLQVSGGWQTSHLFIIPQCYCEYYYCYWLLGGRAWFSTRHLGRGPGYVRGPPKVWTMSSTNQFNNLGPWLTRVVGLV